MKKVLLFALSVSALIFGIYSANAQDLKLKFDLGVTAVKSKNQSSFGTWVEKYELKDNQLKFTSCAMIWVPEVTFVANEESKEILAIVNIPNCNVMKRFDANTNYDYTIDLEKVVDAAASAKGITGYYRIAVQK